MTKIKTRLLEFDDLERISLDTIQEDGKRFYVDGQGQKYPSVTTVTSLLTREHIQLWRKRIGEDKADAISNRAARRGTAFHQLVEDYLRREKEFIEFDDIIQEGMFKGIRPVLDSIVPLALEAPLYSVNLKMAGRVDCVGLFEDVLSIIDFKTSSKMKTDDQVTPWMIQMTAYAIMVEELTGIEVPEVNALVAVEGQAGFQLFSGDPQNYVEQLWDLRKRYENLYGV